MPLLQDNTQRALDLMQETAVSTVIQLYDKGIIPAKSPNRFTEISEILQGMGMSAGDILYWLAWFNIKGK